MSIGYFTDKKVQPDENEILEVIGEKSNAWQELVSFINSTYPVEADLKFLYGKTYGWALRCQTKGKVLTALYPTLGGFTVQINLSEAGVEEARRLAKGMNVARAIEQANSYPEGRWLFIPAETENDLVDIRQLLTIRAEEKGIHKRNQSDSI